MIKKKKGKYKLISHKGKSLGEYKTKAEAVKREKQVKMFKHIRKKMK